MKPPLTGNFELIKKINTSRILDTLRESGQISRADIARTTGLTPATVSNITAELIGLGLVAEIERGISNGGRKPVLLAINPKACYFAGLHIGSRTLEAAIADVDAAIVWQRQLPLEHGISHDEALRLACGLLHAALEETGLKTAGIGVCVHGLVRSEEGLSVYAPNLGWENVRVGDTLAQEFGLPVYVENDVRAMTLAENWCGIARNVKDYVYLYIGPGIGGSIVLDGDLYKGAGGFAGEFGHTTVKPDGPLCTCGNRGCLQAMASETTLLQNFQIRKNDPCYADWGFSEVLHAAQEGDPVAIDEILKGVRYIGVAISNIINSVSPTLIVINGRMMKLGEPARSVLNEEVRRRGLKYSKNSTRIVYSTLGDQAQIRGAAACVIRRMFVSPQQFLGD